MQGVDGEGDDEYDGEDTCNFEQRNGGWVLGVVVLEDDPMRDLVLLEEVKVHTKHPDVEYENADAPPQREILIEDRVFVEACRRPG